MQVLILGGVDKGNDYSLLVEGVKEKYLMEALSKMETCTYVQVMRL